MAQRVVKPKTNLGPGFWPVTAFIVVLSAVMVYFVYTSPMPIGLVQAGDPAPTIDELFRFLGAVAAVIFNLVTIYTIYFGIVFARPKNAPPNTIGVQIHDAPVLEFWWTAIPTILVVILAIYSTKIWADLQNTQGDVLTVEAIGYQFGFQFRYPKLANPVVNELHLPLNTPTTIHITSRDVIHGFWIPEFRNKADMVPGLITTIRVTPTRAGTYRIVCTEFCGVAHSKMFAKAVIESQQDFAKWFAKQGGASGGGGGGGQPAARRSRWAPAKRTRARRCSVRNAARAIPPGRSTRSKSARGSARSSTTPRIPSSSTARSPTPQNVAALIHDGYQGDIGVMPSAQVNQISNTDIANLVAYLASLSKK